MLFFFFFNAFGHPMFSYYVPKTSFHHQKTKNEFQVKLFFERGVSSKTNFNHGERVAINH